MKRYILVVLSCTTSFVISAQIAWKDSTGNTVDGYVGHLGVNQYYVDSTQIKYSASIRVGARVNLPFRNNFALVGWGYCDPSSYATSLSIVWKPNLHWDVAIGDHPTPVASVFKPLPITMDGLFAVSAQNRLDGKAPSIRSSYKWKRSQIVGGICMRDFRAEYQLLLRMNEFTLAGAIRTDTLTRFNAAVQYDDGTVLILVSAKNREVGGFVGIPAPYSPKYRVFVDWGYYGERRNCWSLESGILRNWSVKMLKAKVALSYSRRADLVGSYRQAVNLYMMVTL